jgi:cyclic dehypoxanthinyl futalosine synthase
MTNIDPILKKAVLGTRLLESEAVALLESNDLARLAEAADRATVRLHPDPFRTYNIDCNINYSNVCTTGCRFCAFSRKPGDPGGYLLDWDSLAAKIEKTIELGGNQILLQGGMRDDLGLDWYESLLRRIRENFPSINIHGLSPPEIHALAKREKMDHRELLIRLKQAGLGSLPGGGAEILVDRVRQLVSPKKASTDDWLSVCRSWHELGGRGSATMMFGHLETPTERVEHLRRIRDLQDETNGFTAFIAWTFQPKNTQLSEIKKLGPFEYLKTLAVARLFLDNIPNIQASWVTQGMRVAQLSLRFGANDMGSLMIEENVVASAGTSFRTTEKTIRSVIRGAGYETQCRDVFYQPVDRPGLSD